MKKVLILLLTALISVCSTACANTNPNSSANSSKDSSSKPNPNAQIHSIELSSENAPIITQNNSTNQIGNLDFYYYGITKADEDSHVNLNKGGYVTNIDAIGDIRTTPLRQIVTAVADGAIASVSALNYTRELKKKLLSN